MAPKDPTRQQLSSRLAYSQTTPLFLQRLKNQVSGVANDEEEDFDEWQASSGRPPIPRRPSPPQRPGDDPGSADEDDGDEKPQVVVLREGKHMTALEAENEKRRAKGLPSVPDSSKVSEEGSNSNVEKMPQIKSKDKERDSKVTSLSFSSGGSGPVNTSTKKRKLIGDDLEQSAKKSEKKIKKTKTKKTGALLSFADGNDS